MSISDPIADFLTRVRNASRAQKRFVDVNWSKLKQSLAEILKDQGFIHSFMIKQETNDRGTIRMYLKYSENRKPVIQGLKRMSRPGLRQYVKHDDIPNFYGGLGLSIVSTSQGVIPGAEAKNRKIGGELICMVW
jgi:small subunit ribosomal protein S8